MDSLSNTQVVEWLRGYSDTVNDHFDELNKMDSVVGDGDYGVSIKRGLDAVIELLADLEDKDIGTVFKKSGMKMMSVMGGTSGPLTGTLFINMGKQSSDKMELSVEELAVALKAGVDSVMRLGKAEVGDCTMIDAYHPAATALTDAADQGDTLTAAIDKAVAAAESGYKHTAELQARKGRSSYIGERSIGAVDPGAYSAYLMLNALKEVL